MNQIYNIIYTINSQKKIWLPEVFLSILAALSLLIANQNIWFICLFVISAIQLLFHLYYLYKLEHRLISFLIFFMLLSYVFHFGHLILYSFHVPFGDNVLFPLWYVSLQTYQISSLFTLLVQMMLFLGIYYGFLFFDCKKSKNQIHRKVSRKRLKLLGIVCVLIGIIPLLYIDSSRLYLFIQGGYLNTYNLNVHDFVEIIANFVNFGIFSLLIGYSNNKKVANCIFFGAIIYKIIMMISGGRGESIAFLLGLFIVWENMVMHLSVKQIVLLILAGYLGLSFINMIASIRNIPNFQIQTIFGLFISSLTDNQIANALSEFGSTFSTVCFTIRSNPGPTFGLNYVLPIILILPNLGGFNAGVVDNMIFTKYIDTFQQPIGGSYVAELYYSFHWTGWIFALVLGIFLAFIGYQIYSNRKSNNLFLYLLSIYIVPLLFFWIRGYFGAIYREYIWHCGFAIMFMIFINVFLQKRRDSL